MVKGIRYMLSWTDGTGGAYTRSFDTLEERQEFRKNVERKDWRGHTNCTVWENQTEPTVPDCYEGGEL